MLLVVVANPFDLVLQTGMVNFKSGYQMRNICAFCGGRSYQIVHIEFLMVFVGEALLVFDHFGYPVAVPVVDA